MKVRLTLLFFALVSFNFYAQSVVIVKGKVLDKQDNSIINIATVKITGTSKGVLVDENGDFVLEAKESLPIEITISTVGYKDYKYIVRSKQEKLTILLEEDLTSLDEVVLSASRTPERVFESPVSIERMGVAAIEATTSPSFYDGLENLKGVDVNTSSLTFKSVNTRGFAAVGNTRFVQLVDGMDNSSPGLNFVLGNLIGLNELDVQSVELLPGASSALYGANAFNGIMFMRSKSPFTHQGTTVYGKTGVTSSEASGVNDFIDVGVRVSKKFNDKVAVKFTASLLKATDWFATDTRNINADGKVIDGDRESDQNYNGINVYGDEVSSSLKTVGRALEKGEEDLEESLKRFTGISGRLPDESISRTGYTEQDLIDSDTDSFRAAIAAHFKPFGADSNSEIIYSSKFGTGNTIYQGASRYALRNFIMHQHKLEFQSKHLMVRSYATFENAGDSYDIRFAGINTLNNNDIAGAGHQQWFGAYAANYDRAFRGAFIGQGIQQNNSAAAHAFARSQADKLRLTPGSSAFNNRFDKVINDSDVSTGAKFVDSSRLYHSDVNYNFKELIDFAEVQIGGSARRYVLNSDGTIFTDSKDEDITYDEFGIYTQLQRKLMDDRLKLTGSLRYDKAQNFDGNFSPRASVSYSVDEDKNHNIRASFQTGFRNPTTQDQYIGLDISRTLLIGSAPGNPEKFNRNFTTSSGANVVFNGLQGYENSYTRSSVGAFSAAAKNIPNRVVEIITDSGGAISQPAAIQQASLEAASLLKKANVNYVKPEQVKSYEIGYRGRLSKKTVLDFSAYYSEYKDFIAIVTTIAPLLGNVSDLSGVQDLQSGDFTPTSLYTNTDADVSSYGANIGLETKVFSDYNFGVNYTFAKQEFDQSEDPDFETGFNTPEHKVKVSFGNTNVYKGLGFGINGRWQDAFFWQSTFVDTTISARTLLDAQIMYDINKWNSKVKVGGANILGNEYQSAPGSGTVGSQIYGSWTYNF